MTIGEHRPSLDVRVPVDAAMDAIRHLLTTMSANATIVLLESMKTSENEWSLGKLQANIKVLFRETPPNDAPFGITTHSSSVSYERNASTYKTAMDVNGGTAGDFDRVFSGSKYEERHHAPWTQLFYRHDDPRQLVTGRVNDSPSRGVIAVRTYNSAQDDEPIVEVLLNRREFREFIVVIADAAPPAWFGLPNRWLYMEKSDAVPLLNNDVFEYDGRSFDLVTALTFDDGEVSCIEIPSMRETRYNGSSVSVHTASIAHLLHAPVLVFKLRPFGLTRGGRNVHSRQRQSPKSTRRRSQSPVRAQS
jgi:hypothetical protein